MFNGKESVGKIANVLENINPIWDARNSIMEMKDKQYKQWKQMEWIGFYFQFLCESTLNSIMSIPGPKYGNVSFDGFLDIPWDFKVHAINTSSQEIIVNDREAVVKGLNQYGNVGLILALGKVEYNDEKRTFQKWHQELKGGMSKYEEKRIARGAWSRLRKTHLHLEEIKFILIDNKISILNYFM